MVKTIQVKETVTKFKCSVCDKIFDHETQALLCESRHREVDTNYRHAPTCGNCDHVTHAWNCKITQAKVNMHMVCDEHPSIKKLLKSTVAIAGSN